MAGKREPMVPSLGDKRYVRRDKTWQFQEPDDVGRSSAQDQERPANTVAPKGHGSRGDRKTSQKS